jgi:tetratricopeptide (TPR) repeat protein
MSETKDETQAIHDISDIIVACYQAEKIGNTSLAIQGWNKLLTEYADEIDNELKATTYLNLAKLYNSQGNNDLSLEAIEQAITANPNSGEAYFTLGYFQFEKQNFQSAVKNFINALKFNTKDAGIYNNLANCYDRLGEFDKAIENYTKAITLDKSYIPSFYNRGNVFCKMKEYKNAIKDLSNAIDLDEHFYQAYYNRGKIYELLDKRHLAEKDLKKAKLLGQQDLKNKNKSNNNIQ